MKITPKNLVIELVELWALAFYMAMAVAMLVALVTWLLGAQGIAFTASWICWSATIAIVPVALRLIARPETKVICDRFKSRLANLKRYRRVALCYKQPLKATQKEQRQHPRSSVDYPVRVSTDHGFCGFAMIADLSVKGCRVKSKKMVTPGDFGKLLIYVPTEITPLAVSLTSVRWVSGHQCGLEFILMDLDEKGCLNRCVTTEQSKLAPVVAMGR
jgi:hypothetical protein